MVCLHRIIIVFCLLFVVGISWAKPMPASEGQSIEENAMQIANKEVEALGIKLSYWKPPETGEKIQEEWRRIRLLRREHSALDMQEHLDNQERALAGKDFLPVRYVYKSSSGNLSNVKHGEMWVFIERYTGKVLLVIPPGHYASLAQAYFDLNSREKYPILPSGRGFRFDLPPILTLNLSLDLSRNLSLSTA